MVDVQKEMVQRVKNGLHDLHHELLAAGTDVLFDVRHRENELIVSFTVVGGKVLPGRLVIEESAGFSNEMFIPTLSAGEVASLETLVDEAVSKSSKKGKG